MDEGGSRQAPKLAPELAPAGLRAWTTSLLDAMPQPVLVLDADLTVTSGNVAAGKLFGRSLAGAPLAQLLGGPDAMRIARAAIADGATASASAEALAAGGGRRHVEVHAAPLLVGGHVVGTALTVTSATTAGHQPAGALGPAAQALSEELAEALRGDQIVLHYQPIVGLADERPVALEALVRWEHPQRGLLRPVDFLDVADSDALARPLGLRVLRLAAHAAATWARTLPREVEVQVSVNLSERQLLQPGMAALIRHALNVAQCPPQRLLIEVGETALLRDPAASLAALTAIKQIGVSVALDDLGTGESVLSYLKQFPIDLVKIDRSLIAELGSDPDHNAVVASLVSLAQAIGARCVAEGVETTEQLGVLRQLRCELGQGYLFTRAMNVHAATAWLQRSTSEDATPRRGTDVDPLTVVRILDLEAEGASLHTIAARLNAEGHRNGGRRWHHTSVAQVIAARKFPDLDL